MLANIGSQTSDVIWLSAACLGLVLWIILTVIMFDEEPKGVVILNAVALLPLGLFFFAFSDLGYPVAALWTWRAFAMIGTITGGISIYIMLRDREGGRETMLRLASASSFFLWIGFAIFSIVISPSGSKSSPPVIASASNPGMSLTAICQVSAPIVFGIVGLVFLMFFIIQVQRGDLPSIETNSGGLGGGLGGWRVSGSLTYLVGLIAFGAFFWFTLPRDANKPPALVTNVASIDEKKAASPETNANLPSIQGARTNRAAAESGTSLDGQGRPH
jgi:hypothetical protein